MVMISPCAGCDSPALAHILAVFEMISGIFTMVKTAWWFQMFSKSNDSGSSGLGNGNAAEAEQAVQNYRPEGDTESSTEALTDPIANNTLWTITGMTMGTLNFVLGGFFLVALTQVNYMLLVIWCIVFPTYYILDCISFTSLLKHFTSKERFERLKPQYILSTIISFMFSSYLLWVGISVIHWCSCRREPNHCRFSRDYCHSFHLNFSRGGQVESNDSQRVAGFYENREGANNGTVELIIVDRK